MIYILLIELLSSSGGSLSFGQLTRSVEVFVYRRNVFINVILFKKKKELSMGAGWRFIRLSWELMDNRGMSCFFYWKVFLYDIFHF